jgi:hypothetical protein
MGEGRELDDDVLDLDSIPGVGDVDQTVGGLDDGGVAVFAGLIFEG